MGDLFDRLCNILAGALGLSLSLFLQSLSTRAARSPQRFARASDHTGDLLATATIWNFESTKGERTVNLAMRCPLLCRLRKSPSTIASFFVSYLLFFALF